MPIAAATYWADAPVRAPSWREALWRWAGLFVVVLVTFILVRIAVLNVFYTTGDMHDPGWFASITWHNGWRLRGPPPFPEYFFSEHIAPILWLTNAVSYIVPLAKFDYYAACIAAIHALYAAGIYRAWQLSDARVTPARAVVAIVVALAAAFSGIPVVALALPHTEMAIPAFALWVVIALARRAYVAAAFWLAACLLVREDAGLHVFALLVLWAGVLRAQTRPVAQDVRWLVRFALVALSYSLVAFVAKRLYFPGGDILTRSYLGSPPFDHVTVAFILDRLRFYLLVRGYVLFPMLLTFVWAAISRNPLLPLGYIAALPWLLLNMLAVHPTPGTLGYYYGFPFWLSLAWPLVGLRVWEPAARRPYPRWPYALLLLSSVVSWQGNRLVVFPLEKHFSGGSPFIYHDTLRDRSRYQAFIDYYLAHRTLFGATALDEAVSGLLIDHIDRSAWLELWPFDQPPETMIYFVDAYDWGPRVVPLLRSGMYRCVYAVPGTRIQLATQDPLTSRLPDPMPMTPVASSPGTRC